MIGVGLSIPEVAARLARRPPPAAPSYSIDGQVTEDQATGAYSFTIRRAGNVAGASSVGWSAAPSVRSLDPGALAADFGGSFPSGTVTFAAGEASKTITITPTNPLAQPE